ncbi:MAG: HNH endonuclease [Parcubacteria group bacterium GW2011_GWA1_44_13]|nr:MAG: HNH endonuclease [Parcubacteria group bacterium GW2011_GWA1_44_13]
MRIGSEFGKGLTFSPYWMGFDIIAVLVYGAETMDNKYIDAKGYPRWKDSHILVHRTVAANMVGGRIFPGMVVHHKDGNKRNFRKSNLWIMSRRAHARLHFQERRNDFLGYFF